MFKSSLICHTEIIDELTHSEIKFSKTTNEWTLYKTDFVIAQEISSLDNFLCYDHEGINLINEELYKKNSFDGEFEGLPIVGNFLNILRSESALNTLEKNSIEYKTKAEL